MSREFDVPEGMRRGRFAAMGTTVEVLVPGPRADASVEAVRAIFAEWEAVLSRFRPESELSRLNARAGEPVRVGALLYTVLAASLRAAEATGGLYDPTLETRLVALGYDRSFDELKASEDEAITKRTRRTQRGEEFTKRRGGREVGGGRVNEPPRSRRTPKGRGKVSSPKPPVGDPPAPLLARRGEPAAGTTTRAGEGGRGGERAEQWGRARVSGRGEAWAGPRYESATAGGNSSRQAGPQRETDGLPVPLAAEGEPRDRFEHERTGGGAARPHGGTLQVGGGWRRIRIDPRDRAVTLPAGVGLDFGGIAKGMAVDAAIARLRAMGLRSALVNAGGDLAVLGAPLGGDVWPIAVTGTGIESALDPSASRTVPLRSGALATSGIARRHWRQGGKQRHHLVDPRTGEPAESGLWSVSVAAERCEQAEVAAKVAFLLGMERGAWFLDGHGLAGLLAATGGTWRSVGGWPIEGEASR